MRTKGTVLPWLVQTKNLTNCTASSVQEDNGTGPLACLAGVSLWTGALGWERQERKGRQMNRNHCNIVKIPWHVRDTFVYPLLPGLAAFLLHFFVPNSQIPRSLGGCTSSGPEGIPRSLFGTWRIIIPQQVDRKSIQSSRPISRGMRIVAQKEWKMERPHTHTHTN